MTTLLFTIAISAEYRGNKEIYSAQAFEPNGGKLYHLAEAPLISAAVEEVVQEMRLREKNSALAR
jgi:hypothetical protein